MTGKAAMSEFSHFLETDQIGPAGHRLSLSASQPERNGLAKRFRIPAVHKLEADLTVYPAGKDGHFHLSGHVVADVEQTCVVSLEPVQEHIDIEISRHFVPAEELAVEEAPETAGDEDDADWLDPEGDDPPDPIIDNRLDIGGAVAEEVALALDPYPRKPGATLPEGYKPDGEAEPPSPFAVLAKLKKEPKS